MSAYYHWPEPNRNDTMKYKRMGTFAMAIRLFFDGCFLAALLSSGNSICEVRSMRDIRFQEKINPMANC